MPCQLLLPIYSLIEMVVLNLMVVLCSKSQLESSIQFLWEGKKTCCPFIQMQYIPGRFPPPLMITALHFIILE